MWWTIASICLACLSANVTLQFAPEPIAAHVIAWRDDATLKASCRLAFLTSHVDASTTEEG